MALPFKCTSLRTTGFAKKTSDGWERSLVILTSNTSVIPFFRPPVTLFFAPGAWPETT